MPRQRASTDMEKPGWNEDIWVRASSNHDPVMDEIVDIKPRKYSVTTVEPPPPPHRSSLQEASSPPPPPHRSSLQSRTSWLHAPLTKNFSREVDAESGPGSALPQRRADLLHTTFDLDKDTLAAWSGSEPYLAYLSNQFQDLWCGESSPFFSLLGYRHHIHPTHCFEILAAVAAAFRASSDDGLSISDIFKTTLNQYNIDPDGEEISPAVRQSGKQAVFVAIGWLTMLYKPAAATGECFLLHGGARQAGAKKHYVKDLAKRPIAGFLRGIGNLLPNLEHNHIAVDQGSSLWPERSSAQIQTSAVNYYALKRIGNINVEWVDSLDAHLEFHPSSRTLTMFRFPSFCALNCLGAEDQHCFNRILKEYYDHQTGGKTLTTLAAYKREVLLSYRLIFGQHKRSRRLFLNSELAKTSAVNGVPDPLLARLCGERLAALHNLTGELWPLSCRAPNGRLIEHNVYSVSISFPLLGPRLAALQVFSLQQNPSKFRDLWHDRRNPSQWYTLWAVIVIGGVSLVFQVVQLVLSAAQLASQLRSSNQQNG